MSDPKPDDSTFLAQTDDALAKKWAQELREMTMERSKALAEKLEANVDNKLQVRRLISQRLMLQQAANDHAAALERSGAGQGLPYAASCITVAV
jgi:hypothetical protein